MENIENPIVMPEYNYKLDHVEDDVWYELEDIAWEDIRDRNFGED